MNGPFVVAQASTNSGKPVQTIKLTKPPAGQTETFHASFTGTVKIDFTGIADQKITLYHDNSNQTLHVIFADGSQDIIEPFFDSTGNILANLLIEVGPNQDLDGAQFASQFPITEDQSVLPAAGGTNNASGADFQSVGVDPLAVGTPLPLLPPEELPPVTFLQEEAPGPEAGNLIPTVGAPLHFIVEEEQLGNVGEVPPVPHDVPEVTDHGFGNEDTLDAAATGNPPVDGSGNDKDVPGNFDNTTNAVTDSIANLVVGGNLPITFQANTAADGQAVHWIDGGGVEHNLFSLGEQVFYQRISDTEIDGVTLGGQGENDPPRLIFQLLLDPNHTGDTSKFTFILTDQIDNPVHTHDDGTHPQGALEETTFLDLSEAIHAHDANGDQLDFPSGTFEMGVIDDTPVISQATVNYPQPDSQVETEVVITNIDDGSPTVSSALDDEDQANGIQGGPGDDGFGTSLTGDLGVHYGADGPSHFDPKDTSDHPNPLVFDPASIVVTDDNGDTIPLNQFNAIYVNADGVGTQYNIDIHWADNPSGGGQLIGTMHTVDGDKPVFELDVNVDGTFTFDMHAPLAQPFNTPDGVTQSVSEWEDNLHIQFTYTATDYDGDSVDGHVTINVDDDVPNAYDTSGTFVDDVFTPFVANDEDATLNTGFTGNPGGIGDVPGATNIVSGTLNFAAGADGVGDVTFASLDNTAAPFKAIYADGIEGVQETVTYHWDESSHTLTAVGDTSHNTVFTLTIDDLGTGHFTFELDSPLAQAPGGNENNIALVLPFIITDGDGDQATANLTIEVNDDTPTLCLTTNSSTYVVQDETPGVQSADGATDIAGANSITFNGSSTTVAALFGGVAHKGSDPDVSHDVGGAIGYAAGINGLADVNVSYGADGAATSNAEVFSLTLPADHTDSGLQTTDGHEIYLFNEGGIIVGRYDGPDSGTGVTNTGTDPAAFAITIDPTTGEVYVAQYVSLHHPDAATAGDGYNSYNEGVSLSSGTLSLSVTATDGDGDSVTKAADVSFEIRFLDDGPTVSATLDSHFSVVLDETPGLQSFPFGFGDDNDQPFFILPSEVKSAFDSVVNTGNDPDVSPFAKDYDDHGRGAINFAWNFFTAALDVNAVFGADGPAAHNSEVFSLTLNGVSGQVDSGIKTTEGKEIYLTLENGVIVGRVDTNGDHQVSTNDPAAFAIAIDNSGHVATAEWLSLYQNSPDTNGDSDEAVNLASGTVSATVTVTDGDGDQASASADISGQIAFEDDGPTAHSVTANQILDDEAQSLFPPNFGGPGDVFPSVNTTSGNAGTLFDTGADGFGSLSFTPPSGLMAIYKLASGLAGQETVDYVTHTHADDSSIQIGHTVLIGTGHTSGNTIFTLDVGPDGSYTFTVDEPLVDPLHQTTEENLSINVGFTVTDGDGDSDAGSLTVKVNDDTPIVDVSQAETGEGRHQQPVTLSGLTLDESIGPNTPSDPNAHNDDNGSVTTPSFITSPDSTLAIGVLSTPTSANGTSVADLFNVNVSFGADGPQSPAVYNYNLVLTDDHGHTVSAGSSEGVETNLVATDLFGSPYVGTTDAQRTIYLFHAADGSIIGRVGDNPNGDVALHIVITGSASDPQITVEQYLPIEHPNTSNPDDSQSLTFDDKDASLAINLTVTATDGDGDVASDSKTITLADSQNSFVSIQDDGPSITSFYSSGTVVQDETPGVQDAADPNPANDVAGSGLPTGVLTLFNDIVNHGTDTDVNPGLLDNGALGFATSPSPIVHLTTSFGTDGPALSNAQVLSLSINGGNNADSGLQTTDGHHILLELETYNGQNLIVGRVDGDGNGQVSTADPAAFAIELGQDGNISVAQYLSLKNPIPGSIPADYDEPTTGLKNIQATATVTDGDGDHTSQTIDISSSIAFQDDGPSVTVSAADFVQNSFFFDGFVQNGNEWGNGSGVATGMSGDWTISDANFGHTTDLVPNTGNGAIQLERVGDGYDGGTGTPMHTSTNGFMVDMDASPHDVEISQVVTGLTSGVTYLLNFEAGAPIPSEAHLEVWFGNQKVFDLDPTNSMQSYSVEVIGGSGDGSNLLEFRETGTPDNHGTYLANITMGDAIVVDETPGIQPDSSETNDPGVIGLFSTVAHPGVDPDMPPQYATGSHPVVTATVNFGADGPATSNSELFSLTLNGISGQVDSGLKTTEGKEIYLFQEGSLIVGRYDSNGDSHVDGTDNAAFAIAMNATGEVSVALYVSLNQPDQATFANGFNSYDEGVYLNSGTVSATVTVTDGDGDSASQSADISKVIRFEDDGPTVSGVTYDQHGSNLIVNGSFEQGHTELHGSDWDIYTAIPGWTDGADGIPFEVQIGGVGGINAQDGTALIELDGDFQGNGHGTATPNPNHTDATIQQTIATTAGADYELTFYYSPRPGHSGGNDGAPADDSGLQVLWNGAVIDTIDSTNMPSGWQQITLHVTGTGSDTLAFQGLGPEDEFGALIDNVSLNSVSPTLDDEDTHLNGVGIQGGPGDDGSGTVATGQIHFDAGADGLKQIQVSGPTTPLKAIYVDSNGIGHPEDVSYHWVADGSGGGTLTGSTTDLPTVFTLVVDNTGHFTFTLVAPLDHPGHDDPSTPAVETSFEDNLLLGFGFTVTDGDGDQATGTITINVDDDSPVANTMIASPTLDDEAQTLFPANFGGTGDVFPDLSSVSGSAGSLFSAGADGLQSLAFTPPLGLMAIYKLANGLAGPETLSYHTETHTTDIGVAPGDTLYYATGNTSGNTVFTLLVHSDGSYTFTQDAPLVSGVPTSVTGSLGTQPATEENLAVTIGFAVTDGDGDQATGSLTVNVNDDQPTIAAIQDAIMPYITNTEIAGTWQPQFGADGPNAADAISVQVFSGTASSSEGGLTYVVNDTHTTNGAGGPEVYEVDVKNGTALQYQFWEYSSFDPATQSNEMHAFTDSTLSTAFFELAVNAKGTYNFHVDTNLLFTPQADFDSTDNNSGHNNYVKVDTNGDANFASGAVVAPSSSFPLIIDGFNAGDTNPSHHTVNISNQGIGIDNNNFNPGETLTFTFLSQQSEVDIGVGKSNNGTTEHFTVQLYDQSHNLLATENISQPDGQLLKIDSADWTGTGANAFQNFYEVHVTNAASVSGDDTNLTLTTVQYAADVAIGSTALNFALTTTDGDGDSFTSSNPLTISLVNPHNLTGLPGIPEVIAASNFHDVLSGGSGGGDTVDYQNSNAGVNVNLATNAVSGGYASGDSISGFENAFGSDFNDTLTAAAGGSILYGGGGADTLVGGAGNDILIGGFGDGAVDTLTGNGGNDKFVLDGHSSAPGVPAGGTDIITDFDASGTDSLFVDVADQALTIGTAQTISNGQFTWSGATGGTENDASAWSESGSTDKFFYNAGTHDLWYSANGTGNDKIDLAHMATGVPVAADVHTF